MDDDDFEDEQMDEVKAYLDSPLENSHSVKSHEDVVKYWLSQEFKFPGLSRLALDYLAIPATSVRSEQAFSSSKLMCTDLR